MTRRITLQTSICNHFTGHIMDIHHIYMLYVKVRYPKPYQQFQWSTRHKGSKEIEKEERCFRIICTIKRCSFGREIET